MDKFIFRTVERLVKKGSLKITTAKGATRSFGDGTLPIVSVRFRSPAAQRRVLTDPELKLGEAFVDGDLVLEDGSIVELLELLLSQDATRPPASSRMLARLRFILGSGLIAHSQKITVAARAMVERKAIGHRS